MLDQRAADFRAGGVAVGVQNAGQGMRAFARAQKLAGFASKRCAPLDELGDAPRAFGNQHFGGGAVDEAIARRLWCLRGAGQRLRRLVHGHGDAALRVVGVRFAERFLGDDQNFAVIGQFDGGAQPGHARAHHQIVH